MLSFVENLENELKKQGNYAANEAVSMKANKKRQNEGSDGGENSK
jgi:hypothetical protein